LALAVGALLAGAAAPPPGATGCSGCHAPAWLATGLPVIAGRASADIVAALAAFRSGARAATVMNRIAKGFTPEESQAIAAWWAGQQ
jgi:cytochrome c553